jgi:hypothetical protein
MKYQAKFRSSNKMEMLAMQPSVMSYVGVNCSSGWEMRHLHVAFSPSLSFFAHKRKRVLFSTASKTIGRELELNGVEIARKIASITASGSTSFYRHPLCRRLNFQSDPIEVNTHTHTRARFEPESFCSISSFQRHAQSQSLAQNERDGLVWSMAHQEIEQWK